MGGFQRGAHRAEKTVHHLLDKYGEKAEHAARGAYGVYSTGMGIVAGKDYKQLIHGGRETISQIQQAFGSKGGDFHKRMGHLKQGRDTMMRHLSSGGIGGKLARRMKEGYSKGYTKEAAYTKRAHERLRGGRSQLDMYHGKASSHMKHLQKYSMGNKQGTLWPP
ncbi:MAG: hypothetical protein ACT6FC_05015, partial [Methanosarcinaceae archaeon]